MKIPLCEQTYKGICMKCSLYSQYFVKSNTCQCIKNFIYNSKLNKCIHEDVDCRRKLCSKCENGLCKYCIYNSSFNKETNSCECLTGYVLVNNKCESNL